MHRRPFAADRQACEEADQRNADLSDNHAQAEEASDQRVFFLRARRMQRRYHLRNAAAFAACKPPPGEK